MRALTHLAFDLVWRMTVGLMALALAAGLAVFSALDWLEGARRRLT